MAQRHGCTTAGSRVCWLKRKCWGWDSRWEGAESLSCVCLPVTFSILRGISPNSPRRRRPPGTSTGGFGPLARAPHRRLCVGNPLPLSRAHPWVAALNLALSLEMDTTEAVPAPAAAAAGGTSTKYDRQLRMWGPHGQRLLAESRVCLLGAGPTGTETLKSLVLPGCGHITIVDGGVVTREDLSNNFFVAPACLGQPRAKVGGRRPAPARASRAGPPRASPPPPTPPPFPPPSPRPPSSCCWR
jgi:hypothetical protein